MSVFTLILAIVISIVALIVAYYTGFATLSILERRYSKDKELFKGLLSHVMYLFMGIIVWYVIFKFVNAFNAFNHAHGISGNED